MFIRKENIENKLFISFFNFASQPVCSLSLQQSRIIFVYGVGCDILSLNYSCCRVFDSVVLSFR